MQFIIFAAFAIVLSVPEGGPPWVTIQSVPATLGAVLGHVLLAGLVAALYARAAESKLDRQPSWLPAAQRRLAQGNTVIRLILVAGLLLTVYGTSWAHLVRTTQVQIAGREYSAKVLWGLDEMIILTPLLLAIMASWIALYPADKAVRQVALELRLWAAAPARPVWTLRQYLSFMLRQNVLIILVPMVPIVIANDAAWRYSGAIRRATGIAWADQALLVVVAGIVFFFAPVLLRHIWHTRVLHAGELRERLEDLCRRIGLTYRRILIWESDGMVVNAAVMGLLRPVRYILLSDGLLEMMDDRKIEAVFGHEAGHVKKRHIQYYLLFAVLSMLLVGGVAELIMLAVRRWPTLLPDPRMMHDYMQVGAMGLIVLIWGFGFGAISRRFEWQADLFGAQSVTPPAHECNRPCLLHGTMSAVPTRVLLNNPDMFNAFVGAAAAAPPAPAVPPQGQALCATAAETFAEALERIANLNGIPIEARSWRHSSIGNRMRLLREYAVDPSRVVRLERAVIAIKAFLLVGTAIGLGISLWLYWPK